MVLFVFLDFCCSLWHYSRASGGGGSRVGALPIGQETQRRRRPPASSNISARRFPRCVTWCGYPRTTMRAPRLICGG